MLSGSEQPGEHQQRDGPRELVERRGVEEGV